MKDELIIRKVYGKSFKVIGTTTIENHHVIQATDGNINVSTGIRLDRYKLPYREIRKHINRNYSKEVIQSRKYYVVTIMEYDWLKGNYIFTNLDIAKKFVRDNSEGNHIYLRKARLNNIALKITEDIDEEE